MYITYQTVVLIEGLTALGTRLTEPTCSGLAIATTHRYCQDSRVYKYTKMVKMLINSKLNISYYININIGILRLSKGKIKLLGYVCSLI